MYETYSVDFQGKSVGEVTISREGLYCRFQCRVKTPSKGIYRLLFMNGQQCTDLGVCVPMQEHLVLDKKIAAKNIKEGEYGFKLISNETNVTFIPLTEGEPFSRIKDIHLSRFSVQNGIAGIILP